MSERKTIYLCLAHMSEEGWEQKYVKEAFDTNWVVPMGPNVNAFEDKLRKFVTGNNESAVYGDSRWPEATQASWHLNPELKDSKVVCLSAGTGAVHLALIAAGVKAGDEVCVQSFTFCASSHPITYLGAKPVFIGSEKDTWNMDPVALEKAFEIYPDVKLVVLVHLYGTPAKLDEIMALCEKHNAVLIEDAAESFGATYKGKQTGTFGIGNIISFNGNKIITGSSGGMFLTDSKADADKVRKWSTQSREAAAWYQHEEIGYNYRMSNIIAGVVRGQMPHLEEHIAQKKAIYMRYKEGFKGLPVHMNPYDEKNSEPNFWLSCMIIDKDAMCRQVRGEQDALYISENGKSCPTEILETLAKYNAEGRPIWKPMHMQPIYRMNPFITVNGNGRGQTNAYIAGGAEDVGADIFDRGACLPSDNKMTVEQQERIIEAIRSCFE